MPILKSYQYNPSFIFKYHHFSTIYPSLFRKNLTIKFKRERWNTPDGDFLDLDWSISKQEKLVITLHGLEGSSDSNYIKGVVKMFNHIGYDALAMNFRGCSGEANLVRRNYHSGETTDLDFVIKTVLEKYNYSEIILVGFSLGGNVVMKYAGERGAHIHPKISKIIGVSVPIDLAGCSAEISQRHNFLYLNRFLKSLKEKFLVKQHLYPDLDRASILNSKDFKDFDGRFTAPVHGFESAEDYWLKCSSKFLLEKIKIPALIINAQDDSFLSKTCYPFQEAEQNPNLYFLAPKYGGHVGFPQKHPHGFYWSDQMIMNFVNEY